MQMNNNIEEIKKEIDSLQERINELKKSTEDTPEVKLERYYKFRDKRIEEISKKPMQSMTDMLTKILFSEIENAMDSDRGGL